MDGIDDIKRNLARMVAQMKADAEAAADEAARFMESYAKANAPWTDRTSQLRNSLEGTSGSIVGGYQMVISFSKVYGPFLDPGHVAKRNTTRWSTRKGQTTVQRIRDRAFGSWVSRPILWPTVAHMANSGTAMSIFERHLRL